MSDETWETIRARNDKMFGAMAGIRKAAAKLGTMARAAETLGQDSLAQKLIYVADDLVDAHDTLQQYNAERLSALCKETTDGVGNILSAFAEGMRIGKEENL